MKGYHIEPNRFELRRFFAKVERRPTGCWRWRGAMNDGGYGVFGARDGAENAHRVAYRWFVGAIHEGLDVDHVCNRRACVNPAHLEAVTRSENVRRAFVRSGKVDHCRRGHARTPENFRKNGTSVACRICIREARREKRALSLITTGLNELVSEVRR